MSLLGPQLDAFVMVSKMGTVHAASEQLHLTQTAVTQRIKTLEESLKCNLFIRSRRGMMLSREGEALLHYCKAAQNLEGETLARISGAGTQHEVSLGITGPSSIMHSRILPSCLKHAQKYPQLLFDFNITDNENRHHDLRLGRYDLAVIRPTEYSKEMESKTLQPENYILVCTSRWADRKLEDIISNERIIDFEPGDQLTYHYLQHYQLYTENLGKRHFVNRTDSIAMMLMEGLGYGVLTREVADTHIATGKLTALNQGKTYPQKPLLVWLPRPQMPNYLSTLITAIE